MVLLSKTRNYLPSIQRGFLFLLVLGICCVILFWHALGLPYNNSSVVAYSAISACPSAHAACSGVHVSSSCLLISAPCFTNSSTAS